MRRFNNFIEENYLEESLKIPMDFYMTDDTKMPKEIYGAFDIDGTQYGMSLIATKYNKVYMLDLYRVVNVKKRSWSFIKPQHIRKALSTLIKFMEASYPFLQSKMDGIIIDIPGKTGSEKYVSFLNRVLKKSHVKKYREVPVTKTTDKARNYLFLVKKSVEPASLFTTATFHKNFQFDGGEAVFDSNIMGQTTEPYKTVKKTVSITPSEKFAFGSIKVELSADTDMVDMLDKATELHKIGKNISGSDENKETKKEYTLAINPDSAKAIVSSGVSNVGFFDDTSNNVLSLSLPHLMGIILPTALNKIYQYGYDESKIVIGDLKFASAQGFAKLHKKLKDELIDAGMFTTGGELNDSTANLDTIKLCLASFMYITPSNIENLKKVIESKIGDGVAKKVKKPVDSKIKEFKLELEQQPVSILDEFSSANESTAYSGQLGFVEENENVTAKKSAIIGMPEVEKWYNNFNQYEKGYKQLYGYTGAAAYSMNSEIRQLVANKNLDFSKIGNTVDKENILELAEFFKKAPKLTNGIWVYRNADTPSVENYQVGDDYIDSAFLSTSIRSTLSLADSGNTRLKIYLPKGTRCFPILDLSEHDIENEIVLPPMSMLRITELYEGIKSPNHRMMVCTMVGTAFEDMLKMGYQGVILEAKKKSKEEKYDPELKWGAPTSSYEDSMEIKKLIAKGIIKPKK